MRAYERLINYAKIYTTSDEESRTVPTTSRQFDLARFLEKEMKELGISDVRVDDKSYVYGTIPAIWIRRRISAERMCTRWSTRITMERICRLERAGESFPARSFLI